MLFITICQISFPAAPARRHARPARRHEAYAPNCAISTTLQQHYMKFIAFVNITLNITPYMLKSALSEQPCNNITIHMYDITLHAPK